MEASTCLNLGLEYLHNGYVDDAFQQFNKYYKLTDSKNQYKLKSICAKVIELYNQQNGIYNIMTLEFLPHHQNETSIRPYYGPIIVQYSSIHGRGLFANETVSSGTLLVVEKALDYICTDNNNMNELEIKTNNGILPLNGQIQNSNHYYSSNKVNGMISLKEKLAKNIYMKIQTDPPLREKISYLCGHKHASSAKVPDMSLYTNKTNNANNTNIGKFKCKKYDDNGLKESYNVSNYNNNILENTDTIRSILKSDINLTYEDIVNILQFNCFELEILTQSPSYNCRQAIQNTLDFLCSNVAYHNRVRGMIDLQPKTELHEFLIYSANTLQSYDHRDDYNDNNSNSNNNSNSKKQSNMSKQETIKSHYNIYKQLISQAINKKELYITDDLGLSVLHFMIFFNQLIYIKHLLNMTTDIILPLIQIQDKLGYTVLHYVCSTYYNHTSLTLLLKYTYISSNIINMVTYTHKTALSLAQEYSYIDAISLLLQSGANPCIGHPYPLLHASPYQLAVDENHVELLKLYELHIQQQQSMETMRSHSICTTTTDATTITTDPTTTTTTTTTTTSRQKSDDINVITRIQSINSNIPTYNNIENTDSTDEFHQTHNTCTSLLEQQLIKTKKGYGLWFIPSFCNHSSTSTSSTTNKVNTIRLFIGQYMFLYAINPIQKGEEILIEYSKNTDMLKQIFHI